MCYAHILIILSIKVFVGYVINRNGHSIRLQALGDGMPDRKYKPAQ